MGIEHAERGSGAPQEAPVVMAPRLGIVHWLFHFIALPVVFVASVISIIGLASIYLSPGGYFEGNALDALRGYFPVAAGVLLVLALCAVFTFAGLYQLRKWSLVTAVVVLVVLALIGAAVCYAAWSYLARYGVLAMQVAPGFAHALSLARGCGLAVAVICALLVVYYARRAPHFVSSAELRERERLVTYERW